MFVDSRFKFAEVQRFFDQHIVKYFEDMAIYDSFAGNHPMVSHLKPFSMVLPLTSSIE